MSDRPPLPPFTPDTAATKVRGAEDGWNTRDPDRVVLVYWKTAAGEIGRSSFGRPRGGVSQRKWNRELDYRLIKELWAFAEQPHRGAVRLRVA